MMNKKLINKRLLPVLLGGLLLTTACSNENVLGYDSGKASDGEYVDVSFSVNTQGELVTRATEVTGDDGSVTYVPTIAQGKQVDALIYAVYEVVRDESKEDKPISKYNLLKQYGNGESINDVKAGEGQAILNVSDVFPGGEEKIELRLMRNKEYAVAFWAQNSNTTAYNTSDLKKVVVNYANAKNNDELRDAFCKVEVFTVSPNQSIHVVLQRPLAQINVGTTGADYYNHLSFRPKRPVYESSITLTGVENCINVVTDEISSTEGFNKSVTFTAAKIPAYWDIDELPTEWGEILGSDDPAKKADGTQALDEEGDDGSAEEKEEFISPIYLKGEEFLMINLDGHPKLVEHKKKDEDEEDVVNSMGFLKYKTKYPTLDVNGNFLTETFKYLSMCYVLVPATANTQDGSTGDQYFSTTLPKVTINMGNSKYWPNEDESKFEPWHNRVIEVENVPVHRNWRTNILGGLYYTDTNFPNEPDDPSGFFERKCNVKIYLSPVYEGEYNTTNPSDDGTPWHQDEYGNNNCNK